MQTATVLEANELSTGYFENLGDGTFRFIVLPIEAQVSPVYAILIADIDGDNIKDLVFGGNFRGTRVKFGEYDASFGTVLKGDDRGGFHAIPGDQSGMMVRGEIRDIAEVKSRPGKSGCCFGPEIMMGYWFIR